MGTLGALLVFNSIFGFNSLFRAGVAGKMATGAVNVAPQAKLASAGAVTTGGRSFLQKFVGGGIKNLLGFIG